MMATLKSGLPRHWKQLKRYREEQAAGETHIHLPYQFTPRAYQEAFMEAMRTQRNPGGKLRACCVWHRRAGKDKTFLNFLIPRMFERVGAYYYYFPTASMGRDILWDGMDRDGFKFLDHFPALLVARTNATEMVVELKNGSIFKIRGTDTREPVGVNPVGCVFSEYSRQSPAAGWDLVRPILAENAGWAVFNFTPKGKNHAYRLYRMARENPEWFCQLLKADETQAITPEAIDSERRSGMSEEMIQQEFYCSFDIGQEGSYYGRSISKLWEDGQIGNVPYEPQARVYTAWDIGISDATAIWFFQLIGQEIRLIDYEESYGEGLRYYAERLRKKPYSYAEHYFPPDVLKRQYEQDGGVTTILQVARNMLERRDVESGMTTERVCVVDSHGLADGIEQVRILLQSAKKVWIDQTNCQAGIDALENYHAEYKDKLEDFNRQPCHDWASHGADAFRYLVVAYRFQIHDGDGVPLGYPKPVPQDIDDGEEERYDRMSYYQRRTRL